MTASAKRTQSGEATSDLVLSAHVGGNAELFARVLALHVRPGSRVADVTFGKGVFWKAVDATQYELHASDIGVLERGSNGIAVTSIASGVDCCSLPYASGSFDCVVLDPPYMEGLFRRSASQLAGSGSHAAFRSSYSTGTASATGRPKYHAAVVDLYARAGEEARRVLRRGGTLIVKCQDEVSANRQRLTHVEIVNAFEAMGYRPRDLFVLVRSNRPGVSRLLRQVHARKNHSYFLVFESREVSR